LTLAVDITILQFLGASRGHLIIYGGVTGTDSVIYDSLAQSNSGKSLTGTVTAPCGKATILLQSNTSYYATSHGAVDYGFDLTYRINAADLNSGGTACQAYSEYYP
jgi:hypothetical protein